MKLKTKRILTWLFISLLMVVAVRGALKIKYFADDYKKCKKELLKVQITQLKQELGK